MVRIETVFLLSIIYQIPCIEMRLLDEELPKTKTWEQNTSSARSHKQDARTFSNRHKPIIGAEGITRWEASPAPGNSPSLREVPGPSPGNAALKIQKTTIFVFPPSVFYLWKTKFVIFKKDYARDFWDAFRKHIPFRGSALKIFARKIFFSKKLA